MSVFRSISIILLEGVGTVYGLQRLRLQRIWMHHCIISSSLVMFFWTVSGARVGLDGHFHVNAQI